MNGYSLFLFLALISEIIGTVSGFGSSILFVPIAAIFFDFKTVLGITAVFHVFSNLSKIFLFRDGINKSIAFRLGIPAVVFVIVGAWCTTLLPSRQIAFVMDIALILLSVYLVFNINKTIKQTTTNLYAGGAVSGFLAGITGTGGAVRGITLSAYNLPKNVFIATSAIIDLGVDSGRALVYISNGYFAKENLMLMPFLIVISILGSYLGKLILKLTSEMVFRYTILAVIMGISLFEFVKYLVSNF